MGWEAPKQGWSTTESGGSAIGELGQERREEEQKTTSPSFCSPVDTGPLCREAEERTF